MNRIAFSVAVIAYNQQDLVRKTLDSILSQDHDYPYEIVVGEDRSTDATRSVVMEYYEKYPSIIKPLLNEQNLGIVKNYYNVLRHCHGDYIMQCAGDDHWLAGKVRLQMDFMESHPEVGMAYTRAKKSYPDALALGKSEWAGGATSFDELLRIGNCVPAASVIFRREEYLRYTESVKPEEQNWLMEDYPLWLWFAFKSRIHYFDEATVVYRVSGDSASHATVSAKLEAFQRSFVDIRHYYLRLSGKGASQEDYQDDLLRWNGRNYLVSGMYADSRRSFLQIKHKNRKDRIKLLILLCMPLAAIYRRIVEAKSN